MSSLQALDDLPVSKPHGAARMSEIVFASVLGTVVEWYDFLIYGTAAALVFNKLFFPSFDPAGRNARRVRHLRRRVSWPGRSAAPIFGHFGDRIGRKAMLDHHHHDHGPRHLPDRPAADLRRRSASGAPMLLVALRFLQGIGLGGEWGGAVLMVVENAPPDRRGLLWQPGPGRLSRSASPRRPACSCLVRALPEDDFLAWGWRMPFLSASILVAVGLFVRMRLQPKRRPSSSIKPGTAVAPAAARGVRRSPRDRPDRRRHQGLRGRLGLAS